MATPVNRASAAQIAAFRRKAAAGAVPAKHVDPEEKNQKEEAAFWRAAKNGKAPPKAPSRPRIAREDRPIEWKYESPEPHVDIFENPHMPGEMASAYFDAEGVATQSRPVVEGGVLKGWFLSSYSGRKLGLPTTGNAGGNHNLIVKPGELDLAGLLGRMDRGLLVTELMGQGVNPVTGDYSRGAVGFWVEDGQIQFPVEEVTIAGNLPEMYRSIVAVGRDVLVRGSKHCGSILVDRMTIAGE